MSTRREILESLIALDQPLSIIMRELRQFPWDSDTPLVSLSPRQAARILQRFVGNEITPEQLEQWANAVEGRDDISLDGAAAHELKDFVHRLANPDLTHGITRESARMWIERLERADELKR